MLGSLLWRFGHKKILGVFSNHNQKDLVLQKELLEAGKIVPVIDRRYPLSDVADAIRYMIEGHPRGKVVITVEHSDKD
jgi:NADPH:quinone reductase-like Zn-dependent oxidoreductase